MYVANNASTGRLKPEVKKPGSSSRILGVLSAASSLLKRRFALSWKDSGVIHPSGISAAGKAFIPGTYCVWLKDFMKAGKDRLTRDTVRDATRGEVQDIKREKCSVEAGW